MSTEVNSLVSPSLHPDNVKALPDYDDDTAAVLAPTETAFSEAYEGLLKVHDAREKAKTNPTWNEAQQVIHTQELADKVFARVAKAMDGTRANLEKGIAHLEQELTQPVTSRAAAPIAAEIRAHVKSLPTSKLHSFIQNAIDTDDHDTVTAVLGAPPYLSGLTPEFQKTYLRFYRERTEPDKAKRLRAMQGAKAMIEERGGLVFKELEKAVGMPPHKVKKLREAKTAAEQAFVLKDA
jgi:hypothetical protein